MSFLPGNFFSRKFFLSAKKDTINAFPLWWVNENIQRVINGKLIDPKLTKSITKNNIALIELPDRSKSYSGNTVYIDSLIDKGISGIVIITNNPSGEIQAYNTTENANSSGCQLYLLLPRDSIKVRSLLQKTVTLAINGTFKDVKGRNVYGTIGSGDKSIVVSTPISGWFTCGGERGSGLAIWLGLAKFISQHKSEYTFVFTGNSGHENAFYGAHQFLESIAPPKEKNTFMVTL